MIQKPQNAGFFKPQYLTKNLRYEVEFLDMIRGPRKHEVLVDCFKMVVLRHSWTCPKWQQIVSQFYLNNELSYEVSFLHVERKQ